MSGKKITRETGTVGAGEPDGFPPVPVGDSVPHLHPTEVPGLGVIVASTLGGVCFVPGAKVGADGKICRVPIS
jgi:hypothetical protein